MTGNTLLQGGIPIDEIESGTSRLTEAANKEGVMLLPDASEVPRIGFNDIVFQLDTAGVIYTDHPHGKELDATSLAGKKLAIEGARCIVAIEQDGKIIMFPAAAIEMGDNDKDLGFVVLSTRADRLNPNDSGEKFKTLTPIQQQLLDAYIIQAKKDSGLTHGNGGVVNAGEIGHGALVASISNPKVNIHQLTHARGGARQISVQVSESASSIYAAGYTPRPTGNRIMYVSATSDGQLSGGPVITKVYFGKESQLSQPSGLNAYQAAVGVVAAVVRTAEITGADAPKVDLLANMGGIVASLANADVIGGNNSHGH